VSTRLVRTIPFDSEQTSPAPPGYTEDRYKSSQLTEMGPAFLVFDEAGETDHWTLHYEEVLYVVEGELTLTVTEADETYTVVGAPGDVLTIGKGAKVGYAGTKGTRVFVVFTPLNWQDLID
jgi:ethanolamine utilization protein EutQ (cupin superfamily)